MTESERQEALAAFVKRNPGYDDMADDELIECGDADEWLAAWQASLAQPTQDQADLIHAFDRFVQRIVTELRLAGMSIGAGGGVDVDVDKPGSTTQVVVQAIRKFAEENKASRAAVADGWKLVPITATEEIARAGYESDFTDMGPLVSIPQAARLYEAMVAAAPPAPKEEG